MTGRHDVGLGRVDKRHVIREQPAVIVENLCSKNVPYDSSLKNLNFTIRPGEILGVAGVEGNGQTVLAETLIGSLETTSGEIYVNGRRVTHESVAEHRNHGIGLVPEDRQREGLPITGSVLDGIACGQIQKIVQGSWFRPAMPLGRRAWAEKLIHEHDVRTSSIDTICSKLSGGNQQKVVIARELEEEPEFLILAQPTRGVDLGAIDYIYKRIAEASSKGTAVLLISSDLGELLRLSDRIIVLYEGEAVFESDASATTREQLGTYMVGSAQGAVS